MDLNATLLGEMLTFAVFVWVTVRYIWPPITQALQERQEKIAAGLAAAKQGEEKLASAKTHASQILREAKGDAGVVLQHAKEQANATIGATRVQAQQEREKILGKAKNDLAREVVGVKHTLQQETADLVTLALTKVLPQQVDSAMQKQLVDKVITQIDAH